MEIQEIVDRTIFEVIRLKLVIAGLLPDITLFNTVEDYEQAKDALALSLPDKAVTEVYGVGMPAARNAKEGNRIVIDRETIVTGNIGGSPAYLYEKQVNDTFTKFRYPDKTEDILYNVRAITKSVHTRRVLNTIIREALGIRKYIKTLKDDYTLEGEAVLIERTGEAGVGNTTFFEDLSGYIVKDIWVQPFEILQENIPILLQVQPQVNINSAIQGNLPSQTINL